MLLDLHSGNQASAGLCGYSVAACCRKTMRFIHVATSAKDGTGKHVWSNALDPYCSYGMPGGHAPDRLISQGQRTSRNEQVEKIRTLA